MPKFEILEFPVSSDSVLFFHSFLDTKNKTKRISFLRVTAYAVDKIPLVEIDPTMLPPTYEVEEREAKSKSGKRHRRDRKRDNNEMDRRSLGQFETRRGAQRDVSRMNVYRGKKVDSADQRK